jgi:hypothetical protein
MTLIVGGRASVDAAVLLGEVDSCVTRMPPPISSSTLNDEIKPQELRLHAAKIVAPYLFLPYVMQE